MSAKALRLGLKKYFSLWSYGYRNVTFKKKTIIRRLKLALACVCLAKVSGLYLRFIFSILSVFHHVISIVIIAAVQVILVIIFILLFIIHNPCGLIVRSALWHLNDPSAFPGFYMCGKTQATQITHNHHTLYYLVPPAQTAQPNLNVNSAMDFIAVHVQNGVKCTETKGHISNIQCNIKSDTQTDF